MPIEFLCPQCRMLLATPDGSAGQEATCPNCQLTLVVPSLLEGPLSADALLSQVSQDPQELTFSQAGSGRLEIRSTHESTTQRTTSQIPSDHGPKSKTPESKAAESRAAESRAAESRAAESRAAESRAAEPTIEMTGLAPHPGPPVWQEEGAPAVGQTSRRSQRHLGQREVLDPLRTAGPCPAAFTLPAALAFGWQVFLAHWWGLVLANFLLLVPSAAVALAWFVAGSTLINLALGWTGAGVLGLVFVALAAMSAVRAARGLDPNSGWWAMFACQLGRIGWTMLVWAIVFGAALGPLGYLSWRLLLVDHPLLTLLAWGIFLMDLVLVGSRLGWVPLAMFERPADGPLRLLGYSWRISRGHSLELWQLAILSGCAAAGTLIFLPLVGFPLALAMLGGAYVVLAQEQGTRISRTSSPKINGRD